MTPHWFYRDLFRGDDGPDVTVVAVRLGVAGCDMNETLVALVRGFQRVHSLPITGVVDHATAMVIGESATYGLVPQWFQPYDELGLRIALHIRPGVNLDDAVRRFQSSHGHYPTGLVTEALAIEIGE